MGLHRAGYEVVGVDIEPQPRYPFDFIKADALSLRPWWMARFDLICASPPCQRYSMYSRNLGTAETFPDLIAPTRALLREANRPYAIENVVGAPLTCPLLLCGTMFGLKVLRHRLFETSWTWVGLMPSCNHKGDEIPVYGNGTPQWHRQRCGRNVTVAEQRTAMGIDWMIRDELTQAIPPAYSEHIGRAALTHAGKAAA
jgi:DNA (cytosine-5)-methyltransferase 1